MTDHKRFWLPVASRHRVLVRFFSTFKDLNSAERLEVRSSKSKSRACFVDYHGFDRTFGQLLFCLKDFGAGLVAHELQHIIMAWSQRKRWGGNDSPDEEKIAELAEHLTRDFWTRFYRLFPEQKPTKGVE